MHRVAVSLVASAALLVLAGCTPAGEDGTGPHPAPSTSEAAGPAPEDVVETRTLAQGGADVTAEVHPLVRAGDHVVLTLDLSADDVPADGLYVGDYFGATSVIPVYSPAGIRLLDLAADQVYSVGQDADGRPVRTGEPSTIEPGGTRLQLAYAAPPDDVDSLGLFLPGSAYIEDVPVVDGDVPAPEVGATAAVPTPSPSPTTGAGTDTPDPLDLDAITEAPVHGLESYTRELAGAVSTLTSTEQVQITVGSDVLFAVDSADLSPEAQAALDAAAAHLSSRAPGTVDVVGHTDDVDDDAHNQDLSERRAQAVAAALAERIDTTAYPVQPSGRGESDPVAANDSDENRALNRRVTLTLTSEVTTETEVATSGELPPFDKGPVATGPEGVEIDSTRPYRVTAPRARVVDGHVVVDLEVTTLDDEVDPAFGIGFLSGVWTYREDTWTTEHPASGVTLLLGSTAVYPMDYLAVPSTGTKRDLWLPTADIDTLARIDGGQTRTFSLVYPAVGEPGTVTVQSGATLGQKPFRLTDIPVG